MRASGFTAQDESPDSVIFTLDSNFTLFSSASASVDRCSFASDAQDRDSLASDISFHLAGHERSSEQQESTSGPDRNKISAINRNNKQPRTHITRTRLCVKGEKANVCREDNDVDSAVEDDSQCLDSARSSFSIAPNECKVRRSRSEAISKRSERRRPASLDLNNVVVASSPRLSTLKKDAVLPRKSGAFPSPGTPSYCHSSVGMQKGWSSERVPLHSNGNSHLVNAAFLPFTNNGRTLPSKWEDAERWIFSPVSGDAGVRPSFPPKQRRPKSKSGPLGPPGTAYHSLYSPAVPVLDGGNLGGFMASSPFSATVISANGLTFNSKGQGVNFPVQTEPFMARSVSVHGCSKLVSQSSLPCQDEKLDSIEDTVTDISHAVSRRDMATQMSPEGTNYSSPMRWPSLSASTPSVSVNTEVPRVHSSKSEVKDVQVDGKVTVKRWSKKQKSRNHCKISEIVDDCRKNSVDTESSARDISETAKSISKATREEAKITAWENLQKAKAEAAIRKLEMKLEKKRSSSMDKIIDKLKSAQKRAQEMRNSVLANQVHQGPKNSHKGISFHKTRRMSSFSGCFCHAFKLP